MRTLRIIVLLWVAPLMVWAQAPLIQSISPVFGTTKAQVTITGSGFSSTPSQLLVLFDNVQGSIVSSSSFSILVNVPPQAHLGNVEVINLTNGLSGKSNLKFMESFGGSAFAGTNVSAATTFSQTKQVTDICTCDFDLDGKPDLATTKSGTNVLSDDALATDLIVLKNQSTPGALSFTSYDKNNLPALNMSANTFNINCGDLDGDGKPDLVATRAGGTRNVVFVLKNTNSVVGTPSFGSLQSLFIDVGQSASRVSIRDLNQDGKPELIVSNYFDDLASPDNILYVFVNQSTAGSIVFNSTPLKFTVTGANTSYGLDVQDLDADGKPDIVVNQFAGSDVFILRNTSSGTVSFAASVKISAVGQYINVGTADLNKDGLLDLMLTSNDNHGDVFINQSTPGNMSFKTPIALATSGSPWGVDASDVDGDGDPDVVIANKSVNTLNVFLSDGAATPSFTRVDVTTTIFLRNVKVTDFDGDAKPDFAFTSLNSGPTQFSIDIMRNTSCVSPVILNPSPAYVCSGNPIILKTTPAINVTFDWIESANPPFQSGTSETASVNTAGNYTVKVTGEGGACIKTSPVFVVASDPGSPPATPSITTNPVVPVVCVGGTLGLSTSTTGVTYSWSGPAGFISTVQSPSIANVTAVNAGIYKLTLASGNCKSGEASVTVDVAAFPAFNITPSTSLPGCATGVTLSVNSVSGYTYQWKLNGNPISGQTATTLSATTEGDYSVVCTNTALSCSTETTKTTVTLYALPVAGISAPTSGCTGATITFTSIATFDSRGTPAYSWNFGDTGTSTVASPTHAYTAAGSKSVTQTVSYAGVTGCSANTSKTINIVDPVVPVITAPVTQSCPGESVVLSVTGTFNTITWSTGGTGTTVTVTTPGSYSVNTVDANSCASTASYTLNSKTVPTVTVTADKTGINAGESVQLTASGADTYAWDPDPSLSNLTIANPIATPTANTTYGVTGTLNGACSAKATIDITVGAGTSIPAPLIFTPNGDGDNDLWVIPGIETQTDCTMSIYDGHGSQVYEKKGYVPWDGTNGSKQLPEIVYYYVFSCPNKSSITGTVMIKR
ncbi:MAG: VCBS repeat-containing protein [Bacteroidetes bacterium]|nr:VCBS repeat-containing protein [Bacteroidota bacterium]